MPSPSLLPRMRFRRSSAQRTRDARIRPGFTLVEAMAALSVLAIVGSTLAMCVTDTIDDAQAATEQIIANGIAEQMLDELSGKRYCVKGASPFDTFLGPSNIEQSAAGRTYDDLDDYNGVNDKPPKDKYGIALGNDNCEGGQRFASFRVPSGFFDNWRETVAVYYVSESNPSVPLTGWQTSNFRAAEVTISIEVSGQPTRVIAQRRRVFAYFPEP